jgi:spore germination protein GerM
MPRRALLFAGMAVFAVIAVAALAWAIRSTPRWRTSTRAVAAPSPTAPAPPGRRIKARLFYVSESGTKLAGIERDVAYADNAAEQAREIVAAQIGPVAEPLVSAVPTGTTLRALFLTDGGQAFVDLSRDVVSAHPGGTVNELLTVYTIVNALTANLPAITSVQVLVDGKEIETLAGHVDLRRPLAKNLAWVQ